MPRQRKYTFSAHSAGRSDSYGVSLGFTLGSPFTQAQMSLPFDAFLDLMDLLDVERQRVQRLLDIEAFSAQVAA